MAPASLKAIVNPGCPCVIAKRGAPGERLADSVEVRCAFGKIDGRHPGLGWRNRPLIDRKRIAFSATFGKARPGPILRMLDQPRPKRVPLDVPAHRQEVRVRLNRERPITALIDGSGAKRPAVAMPPSAVRALEPAHELGQLAAARRPDHEVKVIRHHTVGQEANACPSPPLLERLEKPTVFVRGFVQGQAPDTPIHDVQHETGSMGKVSHRHALVDLQGMYHADYKTREIRPGFVR